MNKCDVNIDLSAILYVIIFFIPFYKVVDYLVGLFFTESFPSVWATIALIAFLIRRN